MDLQNVSLQTIDGFRTQFEIRLKGLEPLTFGTETRRSIQLSYKRKNNIQKPK